MHKDVHNFNVRIKMNLDELINLEMQKIKSLIEEPLESKKETKKTYQAKY